MSQSTFLTLQSVCFTFFGVALLFFPGELWPVYGVAIADQNDAFLSWHNTHFMFGLALLCWSARRADLSGAAGKAILGAMLLCTVLGTLITGYAVAVGAMSAMGITDPIFYALLAIGNWYFLRRQSTGA